MRAEPMLTIVILPVEANVAKATELPAQLKTQLVRILTAVSPLSDLEDLDTVERELDNLKTKADMGAQEIARLASQLDRELSGEVILGRADLLSK